LGVQLNVPDPKTFYATLRDVGYTDYPTLRTIGGKEIALIAVEIQ
jgi:hypothetical protein